MGRKKEIIFGWGLICLFLIPFVLAENNLYQKESLQLELEVNGEMNLIGEVGATLKEVTAEIMLYPKDSFRQKLLNFESEGEIVGEKIVFIWKDGVLGKKEYGYSAKVNNLRERHEVKGKINFPIFNLEGYEDYLLPTETIDSENPLIVARATELAEGEDDLFKVVFNLASWVESNINYDLNTLTATASQKASWVLNNKQGVCDEMTSLFIAMSRSLGIPARFVSGISYTESEEVVEYTGKNWAPHGWAEVYFPSVGWVGFDITFGEYGYVDVTHIKLRDGFDPGEASTKFSWLANNVKLEAEDLDFEVKLVGQGKAVVPEFSITSEVLGEEIGPGGFNLITVKIKNLENHYLATTLRLSVPNEVTVFEEKKKVLLSPNEEKEVSWKVRLTEALNEGFVYTFPYVVYSEENLTSEGSFKGTYDGLIYSKKDVEGLVIKEEKKYLGSVEIDCDYLEESLLGETLEIDCSVKNVGNVNLKGLQLCVVGSCETKDLLINQEEKMSGSVLGEVGNNKFLVDINNNEVDEKKYFSYSVVDGPNVNLESIAPEEINLGEEFEIKIMVEKKSYSIPQKVKVMLSWSRGEQIWEMAELKTEEELVFKSGTNGMGKENKFDVLVEWEDKKGATFERK